MKITAIQLRNLIKEEVKSAVFRRRRLSEGHARITSEEVNAWINGDWGFVSESSGESEPWVDIETWVNSPQRTIDHLRDAYDDLTKSLIGISLTPPEDVEVLKSEIVALQHSVDKGY